MLHLCVSLVLHGESKHAIETLDALRAQDLDEGTNISLVIVDNGISDILRAEILERYGGSILLLKNRENLGFSAGVNQCVSEALASDAKYLLLLNPDLLLSTNAVQELLRCAEKNSQSAMVTPKLLRANDDLSPSEPAVLDACGMYMTKELRHLDRGAGQLDSGQYNSDSEVFGGTGACLLLRLESIRELFLPRNKFDKSLWRICPQLEQGASERPQLFDEAFFAYREDADLAWRAQIKGKVVFYCSSAVGYHVRNVTPEVREKLPKEINSWSVRNRFLLQLNNLKPLGLPQTFIPGFVLRNLAVIAAVFLKERSSLKGLWQVITLLPRALENRRFILRDSSSYKNIKKWFV